MAEHIASSINDFLANLPRPPLLTKAEADALEAKRQEENREQRRRYMLARRIPPDDIELLLEPSRLIRTTALKKTQSWLADPVAPRLLVLAGHKDGGKTTAACFAAAADPGDADRRWLREGAGLGRYIQAESLVDAWWHHGTRRDARGIEHDVDVGTGMNRNGLQTCWLLVIDDLGQESGKRVADVGEALDMIVRTRCDARLRTVLTTNEETPEALVKRYEDEAGRGGRLVQRLIQHGLWVDCPFEGLRLPGATQERLKSDTRSRAQRQDYVDQAAAALAACLERSGHTELKAGLTSSEAAPLVVALADALREEA